MTMMSMLQMEEIFGGLSTDREGLPVPAIMGRLCLWRSPRAAATFATYKDFKSSMAVSCQETGEPGVLRFTPDYDMPSVMYYQSFSEKLVGGKIHLLDQCHETLKSSAVSSPSQPTDGRRQQATSSRPRARPLYTNYQEQKTTERPEPEPSYNKPKSTTG